MAPERNVSIGSKSVNRKPEKIVLIAAGMYNILMASLTVFVYSNWLKNSSYDILQARGLLTKGVSDANSLVYVSQIYGFIVAVIGVISLMVASRYMKASSISKGVMVYLGVCVVFSLATADWLGLVAYSVCFVLYNARNKAIRLSWKSAGRS